MKNKLLFSLIFIFGVLISSLSQIMLKKSAMIQYESKIKEYLNPKVIFAYMIFFGATFCSIFAYKVIPLSFGPIFESAGYIFVAFFSWLFLKEKISKQKMIGLVLIILGIVIYAL